MCGPMTQVRKEPPCDSQVPSQGLDAVQGEPSAFPSQSPGQPPVVGAGVGVGVGVVCAHEGAQAYRLSTTAAAHARRGIAVVVGLLVGALRGHVEQQGARDDRIKASSVSPTCAISRGSQARRVKRASSGLRAGLRAAASNK